MTTHRLPLLVTFSGIDGAGKSTQIARLIAYLEERGQSPVYLRTRGGYTAWFDGLKAFLRKFKALPPSGHGEQRSAYMRKGTVRRAWLCLALLDLMRVYGVNIRWWRLWGRPVVCDRYLWDTLVDFRLNFPWEQVEQWWLWRTLVKITPRPDIAFLLTIPLEESAARCSQKYDPFPDLPDVRARRFDLYQLLAQQGLWYVVDATRSVDGVFLEILSALNARVSSAVQ